MPEESSMHSGEVNENIFNGFCDLVEQSSILSGVNLSPEEIAGRALFFARLDQLISNDVETNTELMLGMAGHKFSPKDN